MLHLSGKALLGVLPGDKMFQAQRLTPRYTRSVILHGYGGAKRDMPRTLPRLAEEGWVSLAQVMVGYLDQLSPWCQDDLRPVMGTHRRLPHLRWTTSFSLLLDLLIGAGKTRHLNTRPHVRSHRDVFVRGFSAGSYSGICLLWQFPVDARGKLGGIACPPELLATIPIDKGPGLHLFHYDRDLLCCWQPSWDSLQRPSCVCTQ